VAIRRGRRFLEAQERGTLAERWHEIFAPKIRRWLVLVLVTGSAWLLAGAAFVLGLALGSAQPLTIILTYNHAPAGRSGEALGMRIMANKVTQIAVPLVFGGFGAALGAVPVFLATGVFLLGAGGLSLKSAGSKLPGVQETRS